VKAYRVHAGKGAQAKFGAGRFDAMERAELDAGDVASIAIDILSKLGFHVVALTGKAAEGDYLRSLGAAVVLDRNSMQFGTRPLEAPQ